MACEPQMQQWFRGHLNSVIVMQVAILPDDLCLRLDGSNGGDGLSRVAAGCFSRDCTSITLTPAGSRDAPHSKQVIQGGAGILAETSTALTTRSRHSALCLRHGTGYNPHYSLWLGT